MRGLSLEEFLERAWQGYAELTPDAPVIHKLLTDRGEKLVNDHVALRTFNAPRIGRRELGRIFEDWGYRLVAEELDFPEKRLKANYWRHPDPGLPKVFISELVTERFSIELQRWVAGLVAEVAAQNQSVTAELLLNPGWSRVSFEAYEKFYPESEYAAWTAAFGIRVNHFTVLVNSLKTFGSLAELNAFLETHGIELNASGGKIKGTPGEHLEQSSTMARKVEWDFAERKARVLGCYYEFARRYALSGSGELFQGFIPKSADRIFESTFTKKN